MKDKQMGIYLLLVYGVCYGMGILGLLTQSDAGNPVFDVLRTVFTAIPVLAAVLTRKLAKDQSSWHLSLKVWRYPGLWAFSAIVPGILIALGAVLYFGLFPAQYSGVFAYGGLITLTGASGTGSMAVANPVLFWLVCIGVSAISVPIQLLELGEEIGWREYLLPKQIQRYGTRKAVLLNSLLWGVAHLPLIYFGFNYSSSNYGAPWSNMAMMLLMCMSIGVICCYVTIVSGNSMYAAIVHGVVNIISEVPVFLSVRQESGLLGPNPTGLIGSAGLLLCAAFLFVRLGKTKNLLPEGRQESAQ